jgi:hypothetical protein
VPAAAVIPAPGAYAKVVAVKTLVVVVYSRDCCVHLLDQYLVEKCRTALTFYSSLWDRRSDLEKSRVLQADNCLYQRAWNKG